jgi:alkylation response protein AidB-like acyl-CoA dehydrogenase
VEWAASEDEAALLEAAARFGAERLRPAERAHEKARGYPPALRAEWQAAGFATLALPAERGGAGQPLGVCVEVWAKLAEADPGAAVGLGSALPGFASLAAWSELAAEPGALACAEPGATASEAPAGRLAWLPARELAWLLLLDERGVWLLRRPGLLPLEARPVGLQACGGVELRLDGARAEAAGDAAVAECLLAEARAFAAALLVGTARDAVAYAARYARERVAFGRPIAHHQGLAFQLVDLATEVDAAASLLGAAATSGEPAALAASHAFAAETAAHVCERALQVLGGHGYLYDHPVEKRMRDARAITSLFGGAARSHADAALGILELRDVP